MPNPNIREVAGRATFIETDDGVAVVAVDADAGYPVVDVNDSLLRTTGYDREAVIGARLSDLQPPEAVTHFIGYVSEVVSSGHAVRYQVERQVPAGRNSYQVTLCPLPDLGEDPAHVLTIVRDVTALRRVTRTLREIQELARVGHWTWNLESGEIRWSRELYRLFDVDPDTFEASYAAYLERVHPDDRDRVHAAIQETRHSGEPFVFDHRVVAADDGVRWLHCRGRLVVDAHDDPVRMSGTAQALDDQPEPSRT